MEHVPAEKDCKYTLPRSQYYTRIKKCLKKNEKVCDVSIVKDQQRLYHQAGVKGVQTGKLYHIDYYWSKIFQISFKWKYKALYLSKVV